MKPVVSAQINIYTPDHTISDVQRIRHGDHASGYGYRTVASMDLNVPYLAVPGICILAFRIMIYGQNAAQEVEGKAVGRDLCSISPIVS